MKLTRRKPVLSLSETIPESLINNKRSDNNDFVLAEKVAEPTLPPKKILKLRDLNLNAKSYIVYDLKSDSKIIAKNELELLPPASLVKVLSVMYLTQDLNFSDRYKMINECTYVNGQKVGYKIGEEISVRDLVYSSLIFSGADSICLLSKVSLDKDIAGFNDFAKKIGLKNSNFTNYIGLDFTNNLTNSDDMLTMTKEFLKKEVFSDIVKLKSYELENKKTIYNTNKMLFSEKYSAGVKTGTTDSANENLIYRYTNSEKNIDIIVIILNSADRYSDTRKVIDSLYFD